MNRKKDTEKIKLSARQYVDAKKTVREYLRGEKTLTDLNEKGIKLAMPL